MSHPQTIQSSVHIPPFPPQLESNRLLKQPKHICENDHFSNNEQLENDNVAEVSRELQDFFQERLSGADDAFRGDPKLIEEFLRLGALAYFVPISFGGKMGSARSYLNLVEKSSFHSVPLGLTLGIAGSLFVQPVTKFASTDLKSRLLPKILREPQLGGFMLTEPTGGTDIFSLQTSYTKFAGGFSVKGTNAGLG